MNRFAIVLAIAAFALGACSGNFSTGTGMPNQVPPVSVSEPPNGTNGMPQYPNETPGPQTNETPNTSTTSYAIADAQTGFKCPGTIEGYSCLLRFNIPSPSPQPSPGSKKATPTPSPTPTPTPQPTGTSSASPSPSPTPSGPAITLAAEALPQDAPPMYHTPVNTLTVIPFMMVHLTSSGDFRLHDWAQAQFTMPKEEFAKRGFAVQLFQQTLTKSKTVGYKPLWTFNKSSLQDQTLTFDFAAPKMTIGKNSTYVLVLYGDERPSPAPSTSASP